MGRPHSKIKTSLWFDDIIYYEHPAKHQIVTAKPHIYFNTLHTRQLPLLLKRKNILFYSYVQIYIPLELFFEHDSTKKFYNAFIEFVQKEFKDALLSGYNTYGHTILTTSDFYWFGWFDVYKKNLAIFILVNQPLEISGATYIICSWLSKYFSYTLEPTKEILTLIGPVNEYSLWVNSNLEDLSVIQKDYWSRRYFFLEVFKSDVGKFLDYFFYLEANMITKYCLFFSLFDAYTRHNMQDFKSVEQLFAFYKKVGITKKTFTNIPGMLEDYFFTDITSIQSFTDPFNLVSEYNIWHSHNNTMIDGTLYTKNIELPLFFIWHFRKSVAFEAADRCLQFLLWRIHSLNFMGDYYHLCFDYRKMHSKQQLMELRAPDLNFPIELPNYGYDLENFQTSRLFNAAEDLVFDSSIPDHYHQIQEYKKQHAKEVNEMKNKNYLPQLDDMFEKYPKVFNGCREQMEAKTEGFLQEYISNRTALPPVFIERCQKGGYYLPFNEWLDYQKNEL